MNSRVLRSSVAGLLCGGLALGQLGGEEMNSGLKAPRTFTDVQGRSLIASVVSIDVKSVMLRRESDKKEFTFPITSLSAADQVYLAENRAALGKVTQPMSTTKPLVPRVVSATEVAKAKRFAIDVFMRDRTGNQQVFRWEKRPKLTVMGDNQEMTGFGKTTYEELCDTAGFLGPATDAPEITLCVGNSAEIQKLKQKLAPGVDRTQRWNWQYEWNGKRSCFDAFIFVVADTKDDVAETRRLVFRMMAAVFGCPGSSDEFEQSAFDKNSSADQLAEIDRQLVRLLYQKVANRAGRDGVLAAVQGNWIEMVAPEKEPKMK
jgi:hypothetical protein